MWEEKRGRLEKEKGSGSHQREAKGGPGRSLLGNPEKGRKGFL